MAQLETVVFEDQGACRLAFFGRLDFLSASRFHEARLEILGKAAVPEIVLDFSSLSHIASSGIVALLVVNEHAARACKTLVLANCRPEALTSLRLLKLHRVFSLA